MMMNKYKEILFLFIFFFSCFFLTKTTVNAQEFLETPQFQIQSDESVHIGNNIIFQADIPTLPTGTELRSFLWNFGDGKTGDKQEEVHIFQKKGRYQVSLQITLGNLKEKKTQIVEVKKEIFAYERSIFLLTESSSSEEQITILKNAASEQSVYFVIVKVPRSERFFSTAVKRVEESLEAIQKSETIMIWTDRVDILTLLNRFLNRVDFSQKTLAVIAEGNISLLKNILSGVFSVIHPERIIISRKEAMDEFFTVEKGKDIFSLLQERGYDLVKIDEQSVREFSWLSLGSRFIQALETRGVDESVLLLLLYLPVIVTFVTFIRLIIGFSPAGARIPIVLSYSFSIIGWQLAIAVVSVLSFISYFFRRYFFESHLLYAAKVGVLTSFLGIILFFIIGGAVSLHITTIDFSTAIILVILTSLIDRVAGGEGNKGLYDLLRIFIETIMIAFLGSLLISWQWLQILLLAHPEILIVFLLANIIMGRFTGLRVVEYFRFREILKHTEEE